MVKTGDTPVQFFDFCIPINVINRDVSEFIIGLYKRTTGSDWAFPETANLSIAFDRFPVSVDRVFCLTAAIVDRALPERNPKNSENEEEKET